MLDDDRLDSVHHHRGNGFGRDSFHQKFGQNRNVFHSTVRTFRAGLNIDNAGRC